jgi:hypothetical protein
MQCPVGRAAGSGLRLRVENRGESSLMDDLLFSFTEWLRSTWLTELALWIDETPVREWIVTNFWAIPIIQCIHILAIAASFASILMINARMFNIAGSSTMADTANRYIRVLWWALLVLILSGLAMIIGEPVRELINPYFWIKMVLVVFGILIAIWFHKGVLKHVAAGRDIVATDKATAVFLVILWMMIMYCGRFIAYAPV